MDKSRVEDDRAENESGTDTVRSLATRQGPLEHLTLIYVYTVTVFDHFSYEQISHNRRESRRVKINSGYSQR
ncbi:hypothetical protein J6590_007561 [Homalodisca vitripennis]|nr:hypothetical protein J6590_007561 [Homalodisca vitripennis]